MYRILILAVGILFVCSSAVAQIIQEQGDLTGFLGGEAPGCAYDNFVSHIIEGIADPGYNHYNPLDPQSNGFGHYQRLTESDNAILSSFKRVIRAMVAGDFAAAESLRVEEIPEYPYRIVRLVDPLTLDTYYLFREELNLAYVDENLLPDESDDEVGSFDYGWGLYVFYPAAENPHIMVEMPHPNDDFISPFVGLDMFNTLSAGALFMSGVGREVDWSEEGDYTNSKSRSDPTRYEYHVMRKAHEAFMDYRVDAAGDPHPFIVQMHSYDSGEREYPSIIITPWRFDRHFNPPLYDWSGQIGGMIDRTPWIVHEAWTFGNREPVTLLDFYGNNSSPPLIVLDDELQEQQLEVPPYLWGDSGNRLFQYRYNLVDPCHGDEWLLHMECDELPNSFEADTTESQFYSFPGFPLSWRNFSGIVEFYHPAAQHLRAAMDALLAYDDQSPPVREGDMVSTGVTMNSVDLLLAPCRDPWFESYRIYYDTDPGVDESSSFRDQENDGSLCDQTTQSTRVDDLIPDAVYYLRQSAVDAWGQITPLGETVTVDLTDTEPPVIELASGFRHTWINGNSGVVSVIIRDEWTPVDGEHLEFRVDLNQDGEYWEAGEQWQSLPDYDNRDSLVIHFTLEFFEQADGGQFEVRARDTLNEVWGYSGTDQEQGILDDFRVYHDDDAPQAVSAVRLDSVGVSGLLRVHWELPDNPDTTFSSFRLYYNREQIPSAESPYVDFWQEASLGEPDSREVTLSQLASQPGLYYLSMAVVDWAGNLSEFCEPLTVVYPGTAGCWVRDLSISREDPLVHLEWSPATAEDFDDEITGYRIYRSLEYPVLPLLENLVGQSEETEYTDQPPAGSMQAFYRVAVLFQ